MEFEGTCSVPGLNELAGAHARKKRSNRHVFHYALHLKRLASEPVWETL